MVEFLDANGNLIILTRDKNRSYQVMPSFKEMIDPDKELFLRVEWKSFVEDQNDGFWEKGMTSVPMVAYKLNDQSTYKKVREHFGYKN